MSQGDEAGRFSDSSLPACAGSAGEVFRAALRLGLTAFGGPIAHLGYFRQEYVVRRRWLSDHAFSELVGLCQFLPGPASSQVGFAIGWTRAGGRGALAAWIGFTLPSALLMVGFALVSRRLEGPLALAVIHGLKLAAVAVVAQALIGMARSLIPDPPRMAMAAATAAAMLAFSSPALQVPLIAAGALAGMAICVPATAAPVHAVGKAPDRAMGWTAFALFALLLVTLPALAPANSWAALANVFYRAGALVFGGGHVVLPLLRAGLVPAWMDDTAFLSGYGAAQALPGPLFTVAGYLGAIARREAPIAGAGLAIAAIFTPGLLLTTAAMAFRQRIVGSALAQRAIAGVNAVVVGLLAAAFWTPICSTGVVSLFDAILAGTALLLLTCGAPPVAIVGLSLVANVLLAGR